VRRDYDQVAGDVRDEQAIQAEEADDIRASCDQAEHGWEQLQAERVIDRPR
jgi:hypothetical protein